MNIKSSNQDSHDSAHDVVIDDIISTKPSHDNASNVNNPSSLMLEKTVAIFARDPAGVPNLANKVSIKHYSKFCAKRTADLYITFFALIGDEDLSWCDDAVYSPSFKGNAPFPGKQHERLISGGCAGTTNAGAMHGLVRYEFKGSIIEECRRDGQPHGLRVTCTMLGDVWIRLYRHGERLAQVVLHADLSLQSSIDGGGLKILRDHLHLIKECFVA
mmetsp:Transcript_480/g.1128  ORF Transcript_480/g.1128 Transcript_480/m.1128 type:complete len:216 (-) Transcript_480:70-717(-)